VRTLDRTVVSIPNAQFASMQLENMARRDRIRLSTTIGLHHDTTAEQMRQVLEELTKLLHEHPKVYAPTGRALFSGFGGPSFQVEVSTDILTADFQEYVTIREDLFLRIMDMVSASGIKFAPPY
jgi:small-conductance mechanosensitive channel